MGHVRYVNILTRLRGIRVKIDNFLVSFVSQLPEENIRRKFKEHTTRLKVYSEEHGAMLEY